MRTLRSPESLSCSLGTLIAKIIALLDILCRCQIFFLVVPRLTKWGRGTIEFTIVCPSVRPSFCSHQIEAIFFKYVPCARSCSLRENHHYTTLYTNTSRATRTLVDSCFPCPTLYMHWTMLDEMSARAELSAGYQEKSVGHVRYILPSLGTPQVINSWKILVVLCCIVWCLTKPDIIIRLPQNFMLLAGHFCLRAIPFEILFFIPPPPQDLKCNSPEGISPSW